MGRGFGDEWSYQPGYTDPAPAPAPTEGIPYYLARPEEAAAGDPAEGSSTSVKDWFGMGKDVVGTFVDIFGRQVPQQYALAYPPQSDSGMPVWGWALLGIGAVAVVGITLRSVRKPSLGRRRSRR